MSHPTSDRTKPMLVHAPAKLNLGLYLGRPRPDGLHELCSLFEPLALADLIRIEEAERDEVICAGVDGENLAARALAKLRERGWDAPPLRIEIEKRTPVAAGLGEDSSGREPAAAREEERRVLGGRREWLDPLPRPSHEGQRRPLGARRARRRCRDGGRGRRARDR